MLLKFTYHIKFYFTLKFYLIVNIYWMGQVSNLCGEDIFKKLMEQYGDDFMKFILAEKSKDVIKDKFRDLNI